MREVVLEMGVARPVSGVNAALALRAAGGGLGTLIGGVVYDRWGARVCMCSAQAFQVVAMSLFGWRSPSSLWAICLLAGVQSGMVQNTANVVFADYFGLDIAGSIQGVVQMIGMGGAAFGPITLAGLAELTGRRPVTAVLQLYAVPFCLLLLFTAKFGGRPSHGAARKYEPLPAQP